MSISDETITKIDTSINHFIVSILEPVLPEIAGKVENTEIDELTKLTEYDSLYIPKPYSGPITPTFSISSIMWAEDFLQKSNLKICVVKSVQTGIENYQLCYYKHPLGDFIVQLDFDDNVVSVSPT